MSVLLAWSAVPSRKLEEIGAPAATTPRNSRAARAVRLSEARCANALLLEKVVAVWISSGDLRVWTM
jgi:hypothetical protein